MKNSTENTVVLVNWRSQPGGIEVLLPLIISGLTQFQFEAFILRPPSQGVKNVFENTGVAPSYGSNNNLKLYWSFFKFCHKNRSAVFHVFNIGPIVLFLLRLAGVRKVIYSIHGTIYWKTRKQKFVQKLLWKLALSPKVVFTSNSAYSKRVFNRDISSKTKIQVLYNPFNPERFSEKKTCADKNRLNIMYMGRLVPGKNLFTWLDTAVKIHNAIPGTYFNIYGSGPLYDQLKAEIIKMNAADYIVMHGYIADIEKAYNENTLLMFFSEYESFGNIVVESILSGNPVLVSEIPSMAEILENYPAFLIPKNTQDLAEHIINSLQKFDVLFEMAQNARGEFIQRFGMENHFKILEQIYAS